MAAPGAHILFISRATTARSSSLTSQTSPYNPLVPCAVQDANSQLIASREPPSVVEMVLTQYSVNKG